jgi:hypothetical protein
MLALVLEVRIDSNEGDPDGGICMWNGVKSHHILRGGTYRS